MAIFVERLGGNIVQVYTFVRPKSIYFFICFSFTTHKLMFPLCNFPDARNIFKCYSRAHGWRIFSGYVLSLE